jgi:hypothetical protein
VVGVDLDVAAGGHRQVEQAVAGQGVEHVGQKRHRRVELPGPGAVEPELDDDLVSLVLRSTRAREGRPRGLVARTASPRRLPDLSPSHAAPGPLCVVGGTMDLNLHRLRDADLDLDLGTGGASAPAGKSSLTSRLTPAPQLVFRVSDPDTARALGESMGGGRGRIQRVADRDDNGVAAGAEAAVDRAASSSGQALPTHLQRQFEQSTGADLSGVRVHTGGESATAARAVGAKAYTVGQRHPLRRGPLPARRSFGMHLLAHEVAHTVQQQGGAAHRQHKLEVSTPHDAAEVEADRAADAMVRGEATAIGGGAGVARQVVQRDEAPKPAEEASAGEFADTNKAWAEGIRPDIQDVTDTTAAAKETLSADAEAAIAAITTAQTSYTNYEKKYDSALARFKAGVEAAQKQEEDLRAAAKIVANTALGAYFPLLAATKGAISGVLETVNDAASVAGVVGIVPKPAEKGGASDKGMGPSDKVDWKALLQTTIDASRATSRRTRPWTPSRPTRRATSATCRP